MKYLIILYICFVYFHACLRTSADMEHVQKKNRTRMSMNASHHSNSNAHMNVDTNTNTTMTMNMNGDSNHTEMHIHTDQDMGSSASPNTRPISRFLVSKRVNLLVNDPCGLTHHQESLYVGDCDNNKIIQMNTEGEQLSDIAIPQDARVLDMTSTANHIFIALDNGSILAYEPLEQTWDEMGGIDDLLGLSSDDQFIYTWQQSGVRIRDPLTFEVTKRLIIGDNWQSPVSFTGHEFLSIQSINEDGIRYVSTVNIMAHQSTSMSVIDTLNFPVDTSEITGLTQFNQTLYMTTAGYGEDTLLLIELEIQR